MILGNDISSYQGEPIDFHKMKAAGCQFLYIRVGLGWNKDTRFEQNRAGAKAAGIPWGCYWLPWPTSTTNALLQNYAAMVGDDWGDLPPALDVETSGLGLALFINWLNFTERLWLNHISPTAPEIRKKLVLYTRASHFDQYSNVNLYKQELGRRTSLWVAHYTYSPDKKPLLPRDSWSDYLIHQYSADENSLGATYGVKSKAIDINYFNGDAEKFINWSGLGEMEDPQEPADKYVRVVNCEWLSFRNRPEVYKGDRPAISPKMTDPAKVIERKDGWLYVELSGGDRGWISEAYTELV